MKSCIIVHDISDHFLSLVILENLFLKRKETKMIISRDLHNKNIESLKNALSSIKWDSIINAQPVNKAHEAFMNKLELLIESHLPLKEKTCARKKYLCEPWLTKGIIKSGRKQLKLYEKFIQSKLSEDFAKYKIYRSTLQKLKRTSKKLHYSYKCLKFKNNTKRLWKVINSLTKKQNDKSSIIDHIKVRNITLTNPKKIANEFGKYFSTIGHQVTMKGGNSKIKIDHYISKIPW